MRKSKRGAIQLYTERIDSKAFLIYLIYRVPYILFWAVTGAILGSGLYLMLTFMQTREPQYISETNYYIDFAEGRLEARDYYNAFTWNEVLGYDWILGKAMEELGPKYERDSVKAMLSAQMPSDVRYLTINVSGTDEVMVNEVSTAIRNAMEGFGNDKDEFDSITVVAEKPAQKEKVTYFTWRAAFLGLIIGFLLATFIEALKFVLGDSIYTKKQLADIFDVPVLGMCYRTNESDIAEDDWHENLLKINLESQMESFSKLFLADITQGQTSEKLLEYMKKSVSTVTDAGNIEIKTVAFADITKDSCIQMKQSKVIVVIPFAVPCRQKAEDVIRELKLWECEICGIVLVDVNRHWANCYYDGLGSRKCK